MTIVFLVVLALAAAVVAYVLFVGWKLSSMILHPRAVAYDTVVDEEVKRGSFTREWFDENVHLDEFYLRSPYGYDLHCALWPHPAGTSFPDGKPRVAVMVHGFSYCLLGNIKYASIFHDLGFDCVLYDHRNHGLSGHAPTTMGACESQDLVFVCNWARERFGNDAILGTHGESMGAATVMLASALDPKLSFAMEDCGYSDLMKELRFEVQAGFHLPPLGILEMASLFSRLRGGVFFGSVVPARALKKSEQIPMLFIHGDADELVPFSMLQECYDAKPGKKAKRAFPGAKHANCRVSDPAGYHDCIETFLAENGFISARS